MIVVRKSNATVLTLVLLTALSTCSYAFQGARMVLMDKILPLNSRLHNVFSFFISKTRY